MVLYKEYKKKAYIEPVADIEEFAVDYVISTSSQDSHEGGIDSVEQPEDLVDTYVIDPDTNEVKAMMDEDANEIYQEDIDAVY